MRCREKSIVFLIISLLLLTASFALDSQSTDDVSWEDLPADIYELGNYSLEIDFDITASTLQNYSIHVRGAQVTAINNPLGCTFNDTFVFCPSSNEPTLQVTPNIVLSTTNFTWLVTTYDSVDGIEEWNLSLRVLNGLAPTYEAISPSRYTLLNHSNVTLFIEGIDSQYTITNVTFSYLASTSYISSVYNATTQNVLFTCISTNCSYVLDPPSLINSSNNESYLIGYITINDIAGNSNNSFEYNFFLDQIAPHLSNFSVPNATVLAQDAFMVSYNVTDNGFSLPVGFSAENITCLLYIDGSSYNVTYSNSSDTITQSATITNFTQGRYDWSVSCLDSKANQQDSSNFTFFLDRKGPNISYNISNGSTIAQHSLILFTLNDTYSLVSNFWYEFNGTNTTISTPFILNTSSFPKGLTMLRLYSNDTLNIISTKDIAFTLDSSAPSFLNITTLSITSNSVNISMSFSENATAILFYSTNISELNQNATGAFLESIGSGNTLSYIFSPLSASTQYFYKVSACDQFKFCANSSILNVTTNAAVSSSSSSGGGGSSSGSSSSRRACSDGVDNDNDGLVDLDDPGCISIFDTSEYNPSQIVLSTKEERPQSSVIDTSETGFSNQSTFQLDEKVQDGEIVINDVSSSAGLITGAITAIAQSGSGTTLFLIIIGSIIYLVYFVFKIRKKSRTPRVYRPKK